MALRHTQGERGHRSSVCNPVFLAICGRRRQNELAADAAHAKLKAEPVRATGQNLYNNHFSLEQAFRGVVPRPPTPLPAIKLLATARCVPTGHRALDTHGAQRKQLIISARAIVDTRSSSTAANTLFPQAFRYRYTVGLRAG